MWATLQCQDLPRALQAGIIMIGPYQAPAPAAHIHTGQGYGIQAAGHGWVPGKAHKLSLLVAAVEGLIPNSRAQQMAGKAIGVTGLFQATNGIIAQEFQRLGQRPPTLRATRIVTTD